MDIGVERNAYGRQLDSRIVKLDAGAGLEAVFIRAPIIRRVGEGAQVLAEYEGDPVLVEQGRHMVATFHPELTADSRVHRRCFWRRCGASGSGATRMRTARRRTLWQVAGELRVTFHGPEWALDRLSGSTIQPCGLVPHAPQIPERPQRFHRRNGFPGCSFRKGVD